MKTRRHIVRAGDYLASIAHAAGVPPEAIWDAPENASLTARRAPNILCPGDVLFIPDEPRARLPLALGAGNRFVYTVIEVPLRLRIVGPGGVPRAGQPCTVEGLPEIVHHTTNEAGVLSLEVPVTVRTIRVTLDELGVGFDAWVGGLDPADEPSGRRMRLGNLGFLPDPIHGEAEPEGHLDARLAAFQQVYGPPEAEAWDDVAHEHGC